LLFYRYGDGYILVGFEAGFFIAISTHIKEVGQELFQVKNHKDSLTDIALNQMAGKVATCGDNVLKVHSLQNLEETEMMISVTGENGISSIEWSTDGTMLAVVTYVGNILIYLIEIPKLTSVCGNRIAMLTSLMEVMIHVCTLDKVSSHYDMQHMHFNFYDIHFELFDQNLTFPGQTKSTDN